MSEYYIGLMSGTSLDGVDVALCEICTLTCKRIAYLEFPFPSTLKSEILHSIDSSISLAELGIIDHKLGHLFADAINALITKEKIDIQSICAIGLHGQTVWHEPQGKFPFTMQLGDPNIVSLKTGISVVSDFRRANLAMGGQGAPFAPAFHQFMFANSPKTAVLNIGGMANITILADELIGYDTGPGNVLMDYWIQHQKNLPFDKEGAWAESGIVDTALVSKMLEEPYFALAYPKSTGRELFNASWLQKQIEGLNLKPEDIQATLLSLSVQSIAQELQSFDIEQLIICGGGGKNSYLLDSLRRALPKLKIQVDELGDALEAMAFAWLAYKRVHNEAVALKSVTGAREDTLLGGVYG
ncbi:MAG: anhydro-N-acetylmuramic acid kinase [Campylobacterota bacterium]|nr:anhydro-N-acetylmuramic acid kinase [Campylobacterota bacterium]